MAHWSAQYVGMPYSDCDCAQLCKKIQNEQFNKLLSLPIDRPSGIRGLSKLITNLQDDFAVSTTSPDEGDAVLMIGRGRINHVGVLCYINNQTYVLHAMRNTGMTVLHNINALHGIGLEIEGFYKWK